MAKLAELLLAGWRVPTTMVYYLPELGESELGSPDLTLAAKTVGTDELEPKFDKKVNFCLATNMAC